MNKTTSKKPRILFLSKKRNSSYGVSLGLTNSAKFVSNMLNKHGLAQSLAYSVVDANSIDKEVHKFNPDHVFLEALWVTPKKMEELLDKYPNVIWSVRIHSKTPFLANEGIAFDWITALKDLQRPNLRLSSNNDEFNYDISWVVNFGFDYLPNMYDGLDKTNVDYSTPHSVGHKKYVDIGCFGAIRPLKNQLQQAVSAIIFADQIGKTLRFHINSGRVEQKGEEVLRNIKGLFRNTRHQLVEHQWLPHEQFVEVIKHMDISMQVSFTESFNIVTADAIYRGIPVVASTDMKWVPKFCRAEPTDTHSIISKLHSAYKRKGIRRNKFALNRHNRIALKVWTKYLQSL